MKRLILCAVLAVVTFCTAQAQVKGSGIQYFETVAEMNAYTPSTNGSEYAVVRSSSLQPQAYYYDISESTWLRLEQLPEIPELNLLGDFGGFDLAVPNAVANDSVTYVFTYEGKTIEIKGLHGQSFSQCIAVDDSGAQYSLTGVPLLTTRGVLFNDYDIDIFNATGNIESLTGFAKGVGNKLLSTLIIQSGIYRRGRWTYSPSKSVTGSGRLSELQTDFSAEITETSKQGGSWARLQDNGILEFVSIIDDTFCVYMRNDSLTVDSYRRQKDVSIHTYNVVGVLDTLQNPTETTGTFTILNGNSYAFGVGNVMTVDFVGTGIDFRYIVENRGAIWQFTTPASPDTVLVDTYAAAITNKTATLFQNLPFGFHTVTAEVIGINVENTSGQARGWFKYHDTTESLRTFGVENGYTIETDVYVNLLDQTSNKDMAIFVNPPGDDSDRRWLPSHTTYFPFYQYAGGYVEYLFNGEPATETDYYIPVQSASVLQKLRATHATFTGDVCEMVSNHQYEGFTVNISGHIDWLQDTQVNGYLFMLPVSNLFGDTLTDASGYRYGLDLTDNSQEDIKLGDLSNHFLAESINPLYSDFYVSARIDEEQTKKPGYEFRRKNANGVFAPAWIQHRSGGLLQKLYYEVYGASSRPIRGIGDREIWSFSFSAGRKKNLSVFKNYAEVY